MVNSLTQLVHQECRLLGTLLSIIYCHHLYHGELIQQQSTTESSGVCFPIDVDRKLQPLHHKLGHVFQPDDMRIVPLYFP